MTRSWLARLLPVLAIVGCGGAAGGAARDGAQPAPAPAGSASATTVATAPPPTETAAASPPTEDAAPPPAPPGPGCGPFATRAFAAKPAALLGDRLRVTPLEGTTSKGMPYDIMSAPTADQDETRLMLVEGDRKLVIYTRDLAATADAAILTREARRTTAAFFDLAPSSLDDVPLQVNGLALAAFRPHERIERGGGGVPLLFVIVASKDGSTSLLAIFVDPGSFGLGCADVAKRIASTLAPGTGPRAPARSAIDLSGALSIDLPAGWQHVNQPGPDFDVHHLRELTPLGEDGAEIGVYLGHHPQRMEEAPATKPGSLAGQSVTWRVRPGSSGKSRWSMETQLSLGGHLMAHVWIVAPSERALNAARAIAERLKPRP